MSMTFVGVVALAPTLRPAMFSLAAVDPLNSSSPVLPRKSKLPVVVGLAPGVSSRIDPEMLSIS
jgi:hypothetical protein